jgi:hypothetical protein
VKKLVLTAALAVVAPAAGAGYAGATTTRDDDVRRARDM